MTEVIIDPNVRTEGGLTFAGFEDISGPIPEVGQTVLVREPEANYISEGVVSRVSRDDKLVYIEVDWARFRPDDLPTPGQQPQTWSTASTLPLDFC